MFHRIPVSYDSQNCIYLTSFIGTSLSVKLESKTKVQRSTKCGFLIKNVYVKYVFRM